MAALESIAALGRIGEPEDVADVVGFLAGPRGRWVTGQTIDVSGGTTSDRSQPSDAQGWTGPAPLAGAAR
ncbi:SDR family oxidoreductase [Streptomyces sp. NPDC005409]|uniref:SDR family oxidoreductase n=1 Tax=Streptomyces sp. NPDC005409 TaxID=3155342 RepID=UPI0034547E46